MNKKPAAISDIEDAATSKWLNLTLAPARARVKDAPSAEAVDRMRARIFGDTATAGATERRRAAA